jgi:hypothetical protein
VCVLGGVPSKLGTLQSQQLYKGGVWRQVRTGGGGLLSATVCAKGGVPSKLGTLAVTQNAGLGLGGWGQVRTAAGRGLLLSPSSVSRAGFIPNLAHCSHSSCMGG